MTKRIVQIVSSALAAAFGVQSERARVRDFQSDGPGAYIVAGIAVTAALIGTLMMLVRLVLG